MTAMVIAAVGCGAKKDNDTEIIGGADGTYYKYVTSEDDENILEYHWTTR